jgi:hypothetical protein
MTRHAVSTDYNVCLKVEKGFVVAVMHLGVLLTAGIILNDVILVLSGLIQCDKR